MPCTATRSPGRAPLCAQRIEGGDSGAEQRRGVGVRKTVGIAHQCFDRRHHVLLISAVIADAGDFPIPAIAEISAPALTTCAVVAAVPADTDALSLLPAGDAGTHAHR